MKYLIVILMLLSVTVIGCLNSYPANDYRESLENNPAVLTKDQALSYCYERAKECSDNMPGIERELKSGCRTIYDYTPTAEEILEYAADLC